MEREININVGENQKLAIKRLNGQIIFVDVSRVHGFCASISRFESVFRSSIISATGLSSFREILYSSDFVQRPACHSDPVQGGLQGNQVRNAELISQEGKLYIYYIVY